MDKNTQKRERRNRIRRRIRSTVKGTAVRPRLSIYKSNKHLYAQIVDDTGGSTLVSMSTQSKELATKVAHKPMIEAAAAVGESLAQKAKENGIQRVVFDRSGYRYHGVVKTLAEAARKGGLDF